MSKEIYAPVGGTAQKIAKVYAPVDGKARGMKKVYKGVNGIARQIFEAGKSLAAFAVGESVFLNIDGSPVEFLVVNSGIPSNSALYDSSCDGIWLMMKDIYEMRKWHKTNTNVYGTSDIHAYLNGEFLGLFDAKVQASIKQVKIPYVNGTGSSGAVASGANGLPAKIFLPAPFELGWTISNSSFYPADGAALDYFVSADNSKRIAYLDGDTEAWWTRSPSKYSTDMVFAVLVDGSGIRPTAAELYGVRPVLILPYNAKVDAATNTIK